MGSRLVRRADAADQWMLLLVAFGATVACTRAFLQATGYPQLGDQELHFAHALWGGLLQFVALGLALTVANRWGRPATAITGGVGVGLFIDEIGKFITQRNDYFYPLAAPIIYGALLLTTFLYLWLRRQRSVEPREQLYSVLDQLGGVLEHGWSDSERTEVRAELDSVIARAQAPEQHRLASALLYVVDAVPSDTLARRGVVDRLIERLTQFEARVFSRRMTRAALAMALAGAVQGGLVLLFAVYLLVADNQVLWQLEAAIVNQHFADTLVLPWLRVHLVVTGLVGTLLLVATLMLLVGRDRVGTRCARIALVGQLTVGNLLGFYFSQFAMLSTTVVTLLIFAAVGRYQRRFLRPALPARADLAPSG